MATSLSELPPFMSKQVSGARRFYLPQPSRPARDIAVVSGGWERCAADFEIRRATFPYFTIEFVSGGKGSLTIEDRTQPLSRGSLFTYGPGIAHSITTDSDNRLSKYFVNFSGRGALKALRAAGLAVGECRTLDAIDVVQATCEQLLISGQSAMKSADEIVALYGRILLLQIAEGQAAPSSRSNHALQAYQRCKRYFEQRVDAAPDFSAAARACHVSAAYMSRLFKRFAGKSPSRFVLGLRMNRAAAILEEDGLRVKDVADLLGMDPFHFSRNFKQVHGFSPQAFRLRREQR